MLIFSQLVLIHWMPSKRLKTRRRGFWLWRVLAGECFSVNNRPAGQLYGPSNAPITESVLLVNMTAALCGMDKEENLFKSLE